MKSHTKRYLMESIKHLDSYFMTFLNHIHSSHYQAPNLALSVKRGCRHFFFFFFFKLIAFKLVHSHNVKHLTCTISCSSGLQNMYKLHTRKCSTFTIFTLLHLFTNNKKDITYTK